MTRTARILLVEDEAIIAMDLEIRLAAAGYTLCGSASTGEAAIILAHKTNPDVLIMDNSLPGKLNGIDALQQIRMTHNIPVIFVTGCLDDEFFKATENIPNVWVVLKPFRLEDVTKLIDVALHAKWKD